MPINHGKYDTEAGEEMISEIPCSTRPHNTRFAPAGKQKNKASKTKENRQNKEESKA